MAEHVHTPSETRRPRHRGASFGRRVQRALRVLEELPRPALEALAARLIERIDAAEPDPDFEEETDQCEAHDDDPGRAPIACRILGAGDADDAEQDDDGFDPVDDPKFPWWCSAKLYPPAVVMRGGKPLRMSDLAAVMVAKGRGA